LVQAFRNKTAGSVIAVIILSIILHLHFLFTPVQISAANNDGVISIALTQYISSLNNSIIFIIYIAFLLLQAIMLNLVVNGLKMFKPKGYTIAMSYVLVTALIPQWHSLTPGFIANTFGIWLFYLLSKLYNNSSVKSLLYNTGLLASAVCLLYAPFISLFLLSLFAIAILRPINIKEWIIFLMGCLTPFYLLFSYFFLTDNLNHVKDFIPAMMYPLWHIPVADNITLIKLGFGVFIFLLGFFQLSSVRNQMLIQARRYWSLMLIYLILTLAEPFLLPHAGIEAFIICLIPISAFIANFFAVPQRNLWIINLLFLLFIGIVVHSNLILIKI
jgi:hypothetical protein